MRPAIANASRWRGEPGHYEAWHLRLADPASPASAWIRYGFRSPAAALAQQPAAEVWFLGRTVDGSLYARREVFAIDRFQTGAGGFPLSVGRSRLDHAAASGTVDEAGWDLRWDAGVASLDYGEGRLRRSEIVTTQPAIRVEGSLRIGDQTAAVTGWPGHQLHAWGSRHPERSARMHCNAFAGADDYVEAVSRRHAVRGRAAPAVTMGAVRAGRVSCEAHGSARGLVSRAEFGPEHYEFTIRGMRTRLWGRVSCSQRDLVGVAYRDPDGSRVFAYHTDRADVEARVLRRGVRGWSTVAELSAAAACAYEYASRRAVPGVEVVL